VLESSREIHALPMPWSASRKHVSMQATEAKRLTCAHNKDASIPDQWHRMKDLTVGLALKVADRLFKAASTFGAGLLTACCKHSGWQA
jgi:hypothetical protein